MRHRPSQDLLPEVLPSFCVCTVRPLRVKHPRSLEHSAASSRPDSWSSPARHRLSQRSEAPRRSRRLRRVLDHLLRLLLQHAQLQLQLLLQLLHLLPIQLNLSIRVAHHHMNIASHRAQPDYFAAAVQRPLGANPLISVRHGFMADLRRERRIENHVVLFPGSCRGMYTTMSPSPDCSSHCPGILPAVTNHAVIAPAPVDAFTGLSTSVR